VIFSENTHVIAFKSANESFFCVVDINSEDLQSVPVQGSFPKPIFGFYNGDMSSDLELTVKLQNAVHISLTCRRNPVASG